MISTGFKTAFTLAFVQRICCPDMSCFVFLTLASAHKFLQGETSAEMFVGVVNVKGQELGRRVLQPDGIL